MPGSSRCGSRTCPRPSCAASSATDSIGQTFECAGPKVFTLGELVKLAGRACGHERPVIPLPASLGKLQAMAMELMPGEPLMSRDNILSMRVPNVATGQLPGLQALGIEPACAGGRGAFVSDARRRHRAIESLARRSSRR